MLCGICAYAQSVAALARTAQFLATVKLHKIKTVALLLPLFW